MKIKNFTLIIISLIAATANAASMGIYTGGKLGWSNFSGGCDKNNLDCDKNAVGGGVYLGYRFNDWLSVEGGYDYFGKAKAIYPALSNPSINAPYEGMVQGIELGIKTDYELTHDLSIFGKFGALGWRVDKKGHEIGRQIKAHDQAISPMLGAGFEYALTDNLKTRLEYQWFNNVGGKNTGGSDINFVTIGLNYTFGTSDTSKIIVPPEPVPKTSVPETIKSTPKTVKLTIDEKKGVSLFAFDDASLNPQAIQSLLPMLSHLQQYPQLNVNIFGYTDSIGSESYNLKLSQKRANSIAAYFISQNIDAKRIKTKGLGEASPVADNKTSIGRSKNRRVELVSPSITKELPNEIK